MLNNVLEVTEPRTVIDSKSMCVSVDSLLETLISLCVTVGDRDGAVYIFKLRFGVRWTQISRFGGVKARVSMGLTEGPKMIYR